MRQSEREITEKMQTKNILMGENNNTYLLLSEPGYLTSDSIPETWIKS